MAKKPAATDEGSLLLVVRLGSQVGDRAFYPLVNAKQSPRPGQRL